VTVTTIARPWAAREGEPGPHLWGCCAPVIPRTELQQLSIGVGKEGVVRRMSQKRAGAITMKAWTTS